MEITKEEFDLKLKQLSNENWKVKALLENHGSFDKLPEHLKLLICEKLKVEITTTTTIRMKGVLG